MAKLLVPIGVEAFMTNKWNEDEKRVGVADPDYRKLPYTILGDNMEAEPFTKGEPLEAGVHLHFILPDALTQGKQTKNGFAYPCIPNRWLITRLVRKTGRSQPVIERQSWVVESDYLGTDNVQGAPIPTLSDEKQPYKYLGRCFPLGSQPAPGESLPNLTVYGTGNPAFAAYYPSCRSVLGFHDPLEGVRKAKLVYSVTGWYSSPDKDPVYGVTTETLDMLLEEYRWSLRKTEEIPDGSLYQGMVAGLDWRGDTYDYPTGKPQGKVQLTLGNNSVEALSALISQKMDSDKSPEDLERFLDALQYDILDTYNDLDGIAKVEDQLHKRGFSFESEEHIWKLRKSEEKEDTGKISLTGAASMLLAQLNEFQRQMNRTVQQRESARAGLYEAWHLYMSKYEQQSPLPDQWPYRQDIYQNFNDCCGEITRLGQVLADLQDLRDAKKGELESYLNEEKLSYCLEEMPDEGYAAPSEPVLLFSGDGVSRSYVYGEDGRFTQNGTLACRIQGQEVTGLRLLLEGQEVEITKEQLLDCLDPPLEEPQVLLGYGSLLGETLLLDPDTAAVLAVLAYRAVGVSPDKGQLEALAERIGKLIMAPWNAVMYSWLDLDVIADEAGFTGCIPSKAGVNFFVPGWNTLYLEWKVSWYATKTVEKPDNSMEDWDLGAIDYCYQGEMPVPSELPMFSGRTIVTPHPQLVLKSAIERQLERYGDDPELREKLMEIVEEVQDLSLLSQAMGGLTGMLTARKDSPAFAIAITSEDLKDDPMAIEMTAKAAQMLRGGDIPFPVATRLFYPIRAGFMQIEEVQLLSSFGLSQVMATGLDDIILAQSLINPGCESWGACLPPRITQQSRVRLDWEPADGKDGSPVCGYLVPDLLNHGLMVYDKTGDMLGTVQLISRSGGRRGAVWLTAPLSNWQGFEETDFKNGHLKEFTRSMLSDPDTGKLPFEAMIELINRRQAETVLEDQSYSGDISLLCGRPVVLTRALVSLEAKGNPLWKENRESFGKNEKNDFDLVGFPVYLGDETRKNDGTIGYYQGRDPQKMYTEIQAGRELYLNLAEDNSRYVTLLSEPSGEITLKSGILPVQRLKLPEDICTEAIANLYMGFAMNPLISPRDSINIGFPEADSAGWSWAVRGQDGAYREIQGVAGEMPVFSGVPCLMDGYLIKRKGNTDDKRK